MEARITHRGKVKILIIEPCDEDEVQILNDIGITEIPLPAMLCREMGRDELHIELKCS